MPKKKNKLPNFNKMTYEEEAHFWDTHDITDYEDETEEVEIIFDLKKPREKIVPIRMQAELRDRLDYSFRLTQEINKPLRASHALAYVLGLIN